MLPTVAGRAYQHAPAQGVTGRQLLATKAAAHIGWEMMDLCTYLEKCTDIASHGFLEKLPCNNDIAFWLHSLKLESNNW